MILGQNHLNNIPLDNPPPPTNKIPGSQKPHQNKKPRTKTLPAKIPGHWTKNINNLPPPGPKTHHTKTFDPPPPPQATLP